VASGGGDRLTAPAIDPAQLAAEIAAAVTEFNNLTRLAAAQALSVRAELYYETGDGVPDRPMLMVDVTGLP
jgi:hypothetical protein